MKKTIETGGQALELTANAATPFRYKMTFGEDLIEMFSKGKENLNISDTIAKLAYIMARQNEGKASEASKEDFIDWLENFDDPTIFITNSIEIIEFYTQNMKTASIPKNPKGPRTGK